MKIFNFKYSSPNSIISTFFPVCKKTGEIKYDYEALQVTGYHGSLPMIVIVDGVKYHLSDGCFVYGLVVHPDSKVLVSYPSPFPSDDFTLICQPVDHPFPVNDGPTLVVDQPADESDAYDAFLQAQKLVHQDLYASDVDPTDDEDLDSESILSDYDDDEIPTPYELADDPKADSIVDRIKRVFVPDGPSDPSETGSDVPPAKPKEESQPQSD